jgi:hypothetical protein
MSENNVTIEKTPSSPKQIVKWYVMRDLKRANCNHPAYEVLEEKEVEVFTPKQTVIRTVKGISVRKAVPFIQDLLFIHASAEAIDNLLIDIPKLQYRYSKGCMHNEGMFVPDKEMENFIKAVESSTSVRYFRPDEISPNQLGATVRIVGGDMNGREGRLLSIRGSKKKRLFIEIPNFIAAGIEVSPEYIEIKAPADNSQSKK